MITLHQAWVRTVATLLVLIFGLGLTALAATQYQRVEFEHNTSSLRAEMGAIANLNRALVAVNGTPTLGMLYGSHEVVRRSRAAYVKIGDNVDSKFVVAERAVSTPEEILALNHARRTWRALELAVEAAQQNFTHAAVLNAVAAGHDPFQKLVWDRLNDTEGSVVDVAQLGALEPGKATKAASRIEGLIAPLVIAALALALLLSWLAARRMARLVVNPIMKLRRAAMALGDATIDQQIELPGATAELQDLAATINARAASLRSSHGMLRDQAYTDALSGLPNRKAFTERLVALHAPPGDPRLAVLFVDLDDFKVVNDSLGHAAGDELLRVVAARLRAATRGCDIVARLGGDEFAIVLDCSDQPGVLSAVAVGERTLAALQEPISIEGTTVSVSASIGIAISEANPGPDAPDELLRNADFSMYLAKGQGKNRIEVFAPSMHAEMVARSEFKQELRHATGRGQFVLHYQPVVDIESGRLIGFEALIRWQHPARGLLAPGEFIGLAEDTRDIVEIGRWVIDQACRDVADRRMQQGGSTELWVSVNVSAHQLLEPTFVTSVKESLTRHDVRPACLILELTESVAITNTAASSAALADLRAHGVHIALDDFGMGFSSLRYLHELPVDVIKIDRSFVMTQDGKTHSMLKAIITMGQSLGLTVIAEGIEQLAEFERLRGLGNLAAQGYFIARPMPATDAANFLRHNLGRTARPVLTPRPLVPAA